ncbi:hypothetical protein [Nostoc sp.]|uniref:hypothetical protein n=1 Tax=Nostoc sp. TaxID=1180 RepID=UPI002FF1703F
MGWASCHWCQLNMKSAEFRVLLAVAGRLARAEMKDRATCGRGFYHSAKEKY